MRPITFATQKALDSLSSPLGRQRTPKGPLIFFLPAGDLSIIEKKNKYSGQDIVNFLSECKMSNADSADLAEILKKSDPEEIAQATKILIELINSVHFTPTEKASFISQMIFLNKACREQGFWLNGFYSLNSITALNRKFNLNRILLSNDEPGNITALTSFDFFISAEDPFSVKAFFDLPQNKKYKELCRQYVNLICLVPNLEKINPDLKAPNYVGTNDELSGTVVLDTWHEGYRINQPRWLLAAILVKEAAMIEYFRKNWPQFKNYNQFYNQSEKYSHEKELKFLKNLINSKDILRLNEVEIKQINSQIEYIRDKMIPAYSQK